MCALWLEVRVSSTFYYCVKSIHVALTFELKSFCCGLLGNWSLIGLQPQSDTSPSHFSLTSMHTVVYMPRHVIRIKFTEVNGIHSSKDLFLWHSGYKKTHKKNPETLNFHLSYSHCARREALDLNLFLSSKL